MFHRMTQCRPAGKWKLARALPEQIQPLAIPAGKRPQNHYKGLDYAVYQTGYWPGEPCGAALWKRELGGSSGRTSSPTGSAAQTMKNKQSN